MSGRPDAVWLSTAFSEMLTTELAAGEQLRTIPGENVARMKMDLSLADADAYAPDTLARIRNNLGSDLVVFGSYVTVGEPGSGTIRLDARLQDSHAGQIIAQVSETSPEKDVLQLVSRTGARLRERLDLDVLPAVAVAEVQASLPATAEAARFYSEGLERLRRFDALGARDVLERRLPPIHASRWRIWRSPRPGRRSATTSGRGPPPAEAFKLSSGLPREERLSVEGAYREMAREWKQAIEDYETLFRFFPDNLEYGMRLVNAQNSCRRAEGGTRHRRVAAQDRRHLRSAASTSPRRMAAENTSDFKRMQAAASAAAARGKEQGARLIVARASMLEGTAVLRLGQPERAIALYEQARTTYADAGDRGRLAEALNNLASALGDHGDAARSAKMYEEALAIARAIGHRHMVARLLNNLAIQQRRAGDLKGSLTLNREALAIRREIGDRVNLAVSLNNIGNVLLDLGDLDGAIAHYDEAAGIHRDIGDRRGLARARGNAGVALKMQGQIARAREANEEALAIRRDISDQASAAISLFNIGELLVLQGDLPKAEQTLDEALAIQRKQDIGRGVGYSLFELGNLARLRGDTALARTRLQESRDVRTKLGEKLTAADSVAALALVALAEGRVAGRRAAGEGIRRRVRAAGRAGWPCDGAGGVGSGVDGGRPWRRGDGRGRRAQELVGKTQNIIVKLATAITVAESRGCRDRRTPGPPSPTSSAPRHRRRHMGLVPLALEASVAIAEVSAQADRPAAEAPACRARERGAHSGARRYRRAGGRGAPDDSTVAVISLGILARLAIIGRSERVGPS